MSDNLLQMYWDGIMELKTRTKDVANQNEELRAEIRNYVRHLQSTNSNINESPNVEYYGEYIKDPKFKKIWKENGLEINKIIAKCLPFIKINVGRNQKLIEIIEILEGIKMPLGLIENPKLLVKEGFEILDDLTENNTRLRQIREECIATEQRRHNVLSEYIREKIEKEEEEKAGETSSPLIPQPKKQKKKVEDRKPPKVVYINGVPIRLNALRK